MSTMKPPDALVRNEDRKIGQSTPESTQIKQDEVKILEPELNGLALCLKEVVIKTGQIYSFYADTHKLGIERHTPNPPQSLTAALGREVEKYDQLCDSIEAQLLRAIAALKRDLFREEQRVEAEDRRRRVEASMLPPPNPVQLEVAAAVPGELTHPKNSPVTPLSGIPGRRPSAISISSLNRPQFPLKLDLSSSSLRITEEEAALYSKGLASPVTLAPKSARPVDPNEFSQELMAAFASSSIPNEVQSVAMDLTSMHVPPEQANLSMRVGIGDSSDKPIELDLDGMDIDITSMPDLFGSAHDAGGTDNVHDGLFSPLLNDEDAEQSQGEEQSNKTSADTFKTFEHNTDANDDIFANFAASADVNVTGSSLLQHSSNSVPSPTSLLAQYSTSPAQANLKATSSTPAVSMPFDFNVMDLSQLDTELFSNTQDSDINFPINMEDFYMGGVGEGHENADTT